MALTAADSADINLITPQENTLQNPPQAVYGPAVAGADSSKVEDTVNYVETHDPFIGNAGNGAVTAKSHHHRFFLAPDSEIKLNTIFYSPNSDVSYDIIDAQTGLEKYAKYIAYYLPISGKSMATINRINRMLVPIRQEKTNDFSVKALNNAVQDGVINVQEDSLFTPLKGWNNNFQPGHYLLIAKTNNQSVPFLMDLYFNREADNATERLKAKGLDSTLYPFSPFGLDTSFNIDAPRLSLGYDDSTGNITAGKPRTIYATDTVEAKTSLELIARTTILDKTLGFEGGIKYGPLAVVGSYNAAKDQVTNSIATPVNSRGIYGEGTIEEMNAKAIGIGGELSIGPLFAGVGYNHWGYQEDIKEKLIKDGVVLTENSNVTSNSKGSTKYYGGLRFPVVGGVKANAYIGKDNWKGTYFGFGLNIGASNGRKK